MPTYDYACSGCGHGFERFEPIGKSGVKKCPKCGARKARRMLGTGAGFIFKGAGFYTTDYRKPGHGKADSKPESKGSGESEKKEKKTESKKEESKK